MYRPQPTAPTVLVAPLDWGLGHATRCIPLVHVLLQKNCKVLLAAEGATRQLLEQEFPDVEILHLQGYRISYAHRGWLLPLHLLQQIPRLLLAIQKEQQWLRKVVRQHDIDAVISDNRYGLYHGGLPTVLMTHQLRIQTFLGRRANDGLQRLHYRFIRRFGQCWVPDAPAPGLAGELSHPPVLPPLPVHYLGPLSRMQQPAQAAEQHLLLLLSGPEPQRTLLEQKLLQQVKGYPGAVVLVRGLPGGSAALPVPPQVKVHAHLPAAQLQEVMENATYIVGRCGYSTVMDVVALRKRAIFVPTPGQTEQTYLARHLMRTGAALCIAQTHFSLLAALELAARFPYQLPPPQPSALSAVVDQWLASWQQSLSTHPPNEQ